VLGVCLGNMGHARAARALREAITSDPAQPLVHLAAVAIHLGMQEDAISLLHSANRPDLLNSFYQVRSSSFFFVFLFIYFILFYFILFYFILFYFILFFVFIIY
jgi:hypothetical protein